MKRFALALALLLVALPARAASHVQALLEALFHYRILSETRAVLLALETDEATSAELATTSDAWMAEQKKSIRTKLENALGEDARESFTFFTTRYTEAEAAEDADFLASINRQLDDSTSTSYAALRQCIFSKWIKPEIDATGKWLADVQTWVDLRQRNMKTPSLQAWIARDEPTPAAPKPSLASAEAPLPEFNDTATSDVSPMDEFESIRDKRREKKRAETEAAMKQIAAQRKLDEEAYAAKRTAEAQREADAVRAYSQKLASAEAEAMEQRKNTWSARVKRIAVATVSGALGAVTSGTGAAAGAVVAEELFDDD